MRIQHRKLKVTMLVSIGFYICHRTLYNNTEWHVHSNKDRDGKLMIDVQNNISACTLYMELNFLCSSMTPSSSCPNGEPSDSVFHNLINTCRCIWLIKKTKSI